MGILSKSGARATLLALALLGTSCSQIVPWRDEPIGNEVNFAFTLERNLIELPSLRIDGRPGRFLLGSAAQRTIVDPRFPLRRFRAHALQISEKETVRISPAAHDLRGVADAIIGSEAWRRHAITIDYYSGLVTYQKEGIHPAEMTVFRFPAEPLIHVEVNGRQMPAIVDTTSPDTLVLPGAEHARGTANVRVANTDFGAIDVQYAIVSQARIGNRLLSRFLVTIDYGQKLVGLWRDPRVK
jgi:hypothetical protein